MAMVDSVACKWCGKSYARWRTLKDGTRRSGLTSLVWHVKEKHGFMGDSTALGVIESVDPLAKECRERYEAKMLGLMGVDDERSTGSMG